MSANTSLQESLLYKVIALAKNPEFADRVLLEVATPEGLLDVCDGDMVHRSTIAHALNLLLFDDLLERVPTSRVYVDERIAQGHPVLLDHGALRTVAIPSALPAGHKAFARLLKPLGFELAGEYPLDRLSMCGFVYTHQDYPAQISQFFVSELYPQHFSKNFQDTVEQVINSAVDPLTDDSCQSLQQLAKTQQLPLSQSAQLLCNLASCFSRHHHLPTWEQYEVLLRESSEMAWISTEGNVFNHATDRVINIDILQQEQLKQRRPMKDSIEVAASAYIKQTAYRADKVSYSFHSANGDICRDVPGSFFEFIERGYRVDEQTGEQVLDLRFDSRNAQGIFTMTKSDSKS